MRKTLLLSRAVVLLAALLPALLHAQFQPPDSNELKMTTDPKAPGAAAVYLEIDEIANDPMHYQSTYVRTKVLTEKGKELATVELPYLRGSFKIADIKGRTIHADGTIVPLTVKPEDLMVTKSGETQIGKMVFTLPSAEVGSILEYKYDIRYDDNHFSSPEWQIQRPYFVHKAHYQFTPFQAFMPRGSVGTDTSLYLTDERGRVINSLIWWNRLPPGVTMQTSVNGSYSVDVTDVPPIPDEEWMPPPDSFLYKVFFYYKAESDAADFWVSEAKLWSKDVDKFAEPSSVIRDAVNGLIASTDSDLDKAKKLYVSVQALDNTDYSRTKSASEMRDLKLKEAKHAQDTWQQKSGSSEDIAMLYLAMLRAAGLTAYATKVVDHGRGIFDPSYLSLGQLDSTLVALETGGKEYLLDPGEKMCPFEKLSWRHSDTRGLGQSPQGVGIVTTTLQQYPDNVTSRVGEVTVDAQGGITGQVTIIMTGQRALHWRQAALEKDVSELKKDFDREELEPNVPDGVEAHVDHFLALDDPYSNLISMVTLKGSIGSYTAKRLILPGFFFESRVRVPFVNEEKRLQPVDMHYGDRETDQITYHLPDGVTVEGAPQNANLSWPGHAVFIVVSKVQPGQITIADSVARAFTEAKPEEYQDLRSFYQKVAAADASQLVLDLPAAAKGN